METTTSCEIAVEPLEAPRARSLRRNSRRRPKRPRDSNDIETDLLDEELRLPAAGTMARTKRLILAALRVWELKRGIRD